MTDSPEVEQALDRMAGIREDLVPDALRRSLLAVAERAALLREVSEGEASAREVWVAAVAASDATSVLVAAEELQTAQFAKANLEPLEIDPAAVAEAVESTQGKLRESAGHLTPPPAVLYSLEVAAWRSLPLALQAQIAPPTALPADLEAERTSAAAESTRQSLMSAVRGWSDLVERPDDVVNTLGVAGSLLEQIQAHLEPLERAKAAIEAANAAREAAGISFEPPAVIATPQVLALRAKSKSDQRIAVLAP